MGLWIFLHQCTYTNETFVWMCFRWMLIQTGYHVTDKQGGMIRSRMPAGPSHGNRSHAAEKCVCADVANGRPKGGTRNFKWGGSVINVGNWSRQNPGFSRPYVLKPIISALAGNPEWLFGISARNRIYRACWCSTKHCNLSAWLKPRG